MDATEALLVLHVPPVTESVSVDTEPGHNAPAPVIVPAVAPGLTVSVAVATPVPQVEVTLYEITAVPAATPVTTPAALTVATPVLLLLHVPPVTAAVNVAVVPAQMVAGPVTVPAVAVVLTLIEDVALEEPHALVKV